MKTTTASRLCVPVALLLSLTLVPSVKAQMFSAGHRVSSSYSYSSDGEVVRAGTSFGELSAQYSSFEYAYGYKLDEQTLASVSVAYQGTFIDAPASLPVPEKLQEIAVRLGGQYRLDNPRWSLFAAASPGFREAGTGFESKAFSVPVVAGASFAQARELVWSFGAAYNSFSEYKLLPFAGVYWRFAPKWTLSVGYPQLGVSYELSDTLTLRAGAAGKGGSYWVKETSASSIEERPYRDTLLEYREIRVGVGADWKLGADFKLALDGGVVTDRKIQYHELDHSYNGDPAAYVSVALNYKR